MIVDDSPTQMLPWPEDLPSGGCLAGQQFDWLVARFRLLPR